MSVLSVRYLLSPKRHSAINMLSGSLLRGRLYCQKQTDSQGKSLARANEKAEVSTDVRPLGERIKENTKTATYMGVIVLGVAVTGALFYTVFRELFSSKSPNSVYTDALQKCIDDPRVQDALGVPIKGYGEETKRRRRSRVASSTFERNGILHMRMQFYIQGIRNKATVHLEMRENSSGKYEYRYMFAQLDYFPKSTIIIEDNRAFDPHPVKDDINMLKELKPIM